MKLSQMTPVEIYALSLRKGAKGFKEEAALYQRELELRERKKNQEEPDEDRRPDR